MNAEMDRSYCMPCSGAGMPLALQLHPDSSCVAARHIDVEITRARTGLLMVSYAVTGTIGDLRIPPITTSGPADGLWLHTCFEVFVRGSANVPYYEFNFSPSTQWAAYRFDRYRSGTSIAIAAPLIKSRSRAERFTLRASLNLKSLPDLASPADVHLGISAVIEETNGCKSYWALVHPQGKSDFHHPDCFAYRLGAA